VVVEINGRATTLDAGRSVADAVAQLTPAPAGVAVAVNGAVVPRSAWAEHLLVDGDRAEILTAVQGG
jgi:sulfur carrier protein